jgi:hypothetical protein
MRNLMRRASNRMYLFILPSTYRYIFRRNLSLPFRSHSTIPVVHLEPFYTGLHTRASWAEGTLLDQLPVRMDLAASMAAEQRGGRLRSLTAAQVESAWASRIGSSYSADGCRSLELTKCSRVRGIQRKSGSMSANSPPKRERHQLLQQRNCLVQPHSSRPRIASPSSFGHRLPHEG